MRSKYRGYRESYVSTVTLMPSIMLQPPTSREVIFSEPSQHSLGLLVQIGERASSAPLVDAADHCWVCPTTRTLTDTQSTSIWTPTSSYSLYRSAIGFGELICGGLGYR